jgi:hypothetical protein
MVATVDAVLPQRGRTRSNGVAKATKTKPVRLPVDVADLAERLAGALGESVPDFLGGLLRPLLDAKRKDAAQALLGDSEPRPRRRTDRP